ncbi:hypothetical protein C8R43DRAFT_951590 [Mycena crocata]|nr:hypothetical protein C8R43DRAFT_951590 [Mycena crocata]
MFSECFDQSPKTEIRSSEGYPPSEAVSWVLPVVTSWVFLRLSVQEFLVFLFESSIPEVKQPGTSAFTKAYPISIYLHETIIKPCMEDIALQESDWVINDPCLKVRLVNCTLDFIWNVLNPRLLLDEALSPQGSSRDPDPWLRVPASSGTLLRSVTDPLPRVLDSRVAGFPRINLQQNSRVFPRIYSQLLTGNPDL